MTKTAYQVLLEKCNEFKSTVDDDIALEAMEEYAQFKVKESLDKVRGKVEEIQKSLDYYNAKSVCNEVLEILNKEAHP